MKNIVLDRGGLYYLDNLKSYEGYERYFKDYSEETELYNKRKEIAANAWNRMCELFSVKFKISMIKYP